MQFALYGEDQYVELEGSDNFIFEPVATMNCNQVLAVSNTRPPTFEVPVGVATSYPNALLKFLAETGINAYFEEYMPGKVESAWKLGIAEAIFDIRESGKSLDDNELQVVAATEKLQLGGLWLRQDDSTGALLYNKERI